MLPDLRIVIAAVVSTFIFTVGVGFFASSRLIHDQMTARVDTKGLDDTPINRIALNWPEPTATQRHVDLDFAITAKASRNPVREVAPAADESKPALKVETPQPALSRTSSDQASTDAAAAPKDASRDAEPTIAAPKVPEPHEEKTAVQQETPPSTNDTRVTVHLDDAVPEEPTGSIPAPTKPDPPSVPVSESRPKFAARPEANETPATITKPALAEPAKAPPIRKKRPRKITAQKPATHGQAVQTPQLQAFDFFGLFRTSSTTFRLPAIVSTPPTTPVQ